MQFQRTQDRASNPAFLIETDTFKGLLSLFAAFSNNQSISLLSRPVALMTGKLSAVFFNVIHQLPHTQPCSDQPQRRLLTEPEHAEAPTVYRSLRFDKSPWIVAWPRRWSGVPLEGFTTGSLPGSSGHASHSPAWRLLHETFPSNRAIFRPANFSISTDDTGILTLRKEEGYLREYTSASLCSHKSFRYGRFEAQIRPASIPGVVTGMFLHRNSPRQEIDIEFLGRDTTKMLVNVFYNPGDDGARFDYGYRGTPMLIDLGFDASLDFHTYAMDWSPTVLRMACRWPHRSPKGQLEAYSSAPPPNALLHQSMAVPVQATSRQASRR